MSRATFFAGAALIAMSSFFACSDPEHPEPIGDGGGDMDPAVDVGIGNTTSQGGTSGQPGTSEGGIAGTSTSGSSFGGTSGSSFGGTSGSSFGGTSGSSFGGSSFGGTSTSSFGGTDTLGGTFSAAGTTAAP